MDKSPIVYKRRRSGRPLSELQWNSLAFQADPDSDEGDENTSPSRRGQGEENVTPTRERGKAWSAPPLAKRRLRNSTLAKGESSLKTKADKNRANTVESTPIRKRTPVGKIEKYFTPTRKGTSLGNKDKDKAKSAERTPARIGTLFGSLKERAQNEEITPTRRRANKAVDKAVDEGAGWLSYYSPAGFVKEKQKLFAEIDAFELESEEEEPEEKEVLLPSDDSPSPESGEGEKGIPPESTKPDPKSEEPRKGTGRTRASGHVFTTKVDEHRKEPSGSEPSVTNQGQNVEESTQEKSDLKPSDANSGPRAESV